MAVGDILPEPASIGTPEFLPAYQSPGGPREAHLYFEGTSYPELGMAGQQHFEAFNRFHVAVDGTRINPLDGTLIPVPDRSRHPELAAFHDDLVSRYPATDGRGPRSRMWDAQIPIEARMPPPGTLPPEAAISDELIEAYMRHLPDETEAMVRAGERRYELDLLLQQRQLEALRGYASVNDIPLPNIPGLDVMRDTHPQPTVDELIAGRQTVVDQLQRELGYVRDNLQRIADFWTRNPRDSSLPPDPPPLPIDPTPPPVDPVLPAGGGGGYYGGGGSGFWEAQAERAAQKSSTSAAEVAAGSQKLASESHGNMGVLAAAVGLGALTYALTDKSKGKGEDKGPETPGR